MTEQTHYQAIIAEVDHYLDTLADPLQAHSRAYVQGLSQGSFTQMMCLLPYWLQEVLPVSAEVCHRLGTAHFYMSWYYHVQDTFDVK